MSLLRQNLTRHVAEYCARCAVVLQALISEIETTTKVLETTSKPMLYERLEEIQQQLILCEKALAEYLEKKRLAFPRFYFVSSADLLDILSNGNNPKAVCLFLDELSLLVRCFPTSFPKYGNAVKQSGVIEKTVKLLLTKTASFAAIQHVLPELMACIQAVVWR